MAGPIEQFEIKPIVALEFGALDLSFTNSAFFMVASVAIVTLLITLSMRGHMLVPNRMQSISELMYEFVANMVKENVGQEGRPYFPFVFTLFMFILFGNMLGMIPYSFTFTSHIIVTFGLAAMVFIGVTVLGFAKHGTHFFSLFVPEGAPKVLLPLIILIEVISYLSRPVSLSIRLFANMMAGHTMLKVFAGFTVAMGVFGVAPLAINVALTGFEFLVAFLQAYVFALLTCLYINDAIHLH
ncbi:MAG: F0F1 ATP synthase subunit A [Alphaproteobacteria bacterium]|nr:F0F1 ATP synthase subunit A [Alphaproteobacteria bacterium]